MQTWEVTGTLLVGRAAATGATSNAVAARAANRAMVPSSLFLAYQGLAPRASPITARNSSSLLFVCVTELHLTINSQNLHTLDVFLLRLYTTNTWHERRGVTNHMAPGRLRPYKPEGSTFTTNYPPGREFEARTQSKQFFAF